MRPSATTWPSTTADRGGRTATRRAPPGWWPLLANTLLVTAVVTVLRPTTSYRALELGVPTAWLGFVAASFAVVPLLVAVLVGRATDRRGSAPVLVLGVLLVVAAAGGLALASSSLVLLLLWSALLGLGHLLSTVASQALAADLWPVGSRDAAFGHYTFAASVGQLIGPGVVAVLGGSSVRPDTGPVFAAGAALSVLALGTCWLLRGFTTPAPAAGDSAPGGEPGGVRAALRVPGLGPAVLTSMTVLAAVDLIAIYLPALGTQRGLSASVVGLLLVLRAAASLVSRFFLGALVARLGRRRLLTGCLALSAAALATLALPMPVLGLAVAMSVAGFGLGVGQPLTLSWVADRAPVPVRATALALRLTGNRLGQTLIPGTVGLVASASGAGGVLAAMSAALAAVGVMTARLRG